MGVGVLLWLMFGGDFALKSGVGLLLFGQNIIGWLCDILFYKIIKALLLVYQYDSLQ
jgi:hypothetical protein